MKTKPECYGGMFPDLSQVLFNTPREGKDIEVEARDGLTGQVIRVRTLNGTVAGLQPASAVAWFGQTKGPDGSWVFAGCFKQGFFANQTNLQKWLEARPTMTGRQITIDQALADKMKLSSLGAALAIVAGRHAGSEVAAPRLRAARPCRRGVACSRPLLRCVANTQRSARRRQS